jgi:hypothetical protein
MIAKEKKDADNQVDDICDERCEGGGVRVVLNDICGMVAHLYTLWTPNYTEEYPRPHQHNYEGKKQDPTPWMELLSNGVDASGSGTDGAYEQCLVYRGEKLTSSGFSTRQRGRAFLFYGIWSDVAYEHYIEKKETNYWWLLPQLLPPQRGYL